MNASGWNLRMGRDSPLLYENGRPRAGARGDSAGGEG